MASPSLFEAYFKALLECTEDAVLVVDRLTRQMLYSNSRLSEVVQLPETVANDSNAQNILAHLQSVLEAPSSFFTDLAALPEGDSSGKNQLRLKGGRVIDARWLSVQGPNNESAVIFIFRDGTRKATLEAHLYQASKMLGFGEFASAMLHDINNPLTILNAKVSSVRKLAKAEPLEPEKITKAADSIAQAVDRITTISRGLRTYIRSPDKDSVSVMPLKSIIDDTMAIWAPRVKGTDLNLKVTGDFDAQAEIRPSHFCQALVALLNNSYDAIINESGEKWIVIDCGKEGSNVYMSVTDSGKGISPEVQAKIMEPFYSSKGPQRGSGLGLSLVKGIAESYGGSLKVDSASPNTRFVISFPARSKVSLKSA